MEQHPNLDPALDAIYERLYQIDLVYQSGCWSLCGDAHCCSFSRHKARFRLLGAGAGQELPLLPGEYEFLQRRGWLAQFGADAVRRVVPVAVGAGTVRLDTLTSMRPSCACDHGTRTTVCRLYPLVPVFDIDGHLVGTEPLGIYETLEQLDGMEPACRLSSLPFAQLNLFLEITRLIASHPLLLYHLMAYRITRQHIAERLAAQQQAARDTGQTPRSAFALFEGAFLRQRLFDRPALTAALGALWTQFERRHGPDFAAALAGLGSGLAGSAPAVLSAAGPRAAGPDMPAG